MGVQGHQLKLVAFAGAATLALALASCGPANDRPLSGAVPGSEVRTPAGVPPTLTASEGLLSRSASAPSPGLAPSPSPLASPAAVAAPPIVRTIAPGAEGHVPAGAPVALSAVLVGRGADLASASLSVNGADVGAQIDKRTAREWSIHTNQTLGIGSYTAKVLVRDASGAAGGFTWHFLVGDAAPAPADDPAKPAVQPSPVPKPRSP
ncbi:MAG TPA: hypothetical protein VKV73_25070 [Chloroflexota bacterium]|nr:hypothetical protein [Chloroflexota bacterium]